jgi:mannose-6-phosphate isomerase-like protein (cupin superfamily)
MKESINTMNLAQEYYTEEKCHIIEISNDDSDPELSIARARVEPGVTTRWHRLVDTSERYIILSGKGRVEIGALPATEVSAGDVVNIPPMCPQRISNIGSDELVFFAVCSPRFKPEAYQDIEDELE